MTGVQTCALPISAYAPRLEPLRWLIEQGAPLNTTDVKGRRALDIAIDTERFARRTPEEKLAIAQLLGGGAADVARGRFADHPLHQAIRAKDLKAVEALLAQGADANVRDESGFGPIHHAIGYCETSLNTTQTQAFGRKLLALLLRHGADPRRVYDSWAGSTDIDHARQLRLLDLLESEMRRNSPRR